MKRSTAGKRPTDDRQDPAHRWLRQAKALRVRLLRNSLPGTFLQMEFLRQAAARNRVHRHWQLSLSRLYPQIHLAIQPLLRKTAWREPPVKVIRERGGAPAGPPRPGAERRVPEAAVRQTPAERLDSPSGDDLRIRRRGTRAANEFSTLAARLRRYTTLRDETSESVSELVFHRVARQAARVEETPHRPVLVIRRPAAGTIVARRLAASNSAQPVHPPRVTETTHEAPWARAATAPPMNIEYLTDQVIRQIDSRMVAMRERMGRI